MVKKKGSTRDRLALTVLAIQQAVKVMEEDIRWLKREVRKLTAKETKR